MTRLLSLALLAAACHSTPTATVTPAPVAPSSIALPGAPADGVFLDYLAYEPAHHRVWVPAGGTGKVDVIDATTLALTPIEGFVTKEVERRGGKRMMGPSAAAVGDGVVYIGNRGDSSVCAFDAATLAKGACATLTSSPDGLQYIARTKEVWVTTPRDQSIAILDASAPSALPQKATVKFEGEPEGFAVDEARGVFYTNLEDKDRTLAVDVGTRATVHVWEPKCGEDGPKGLIFDAATGHLVVVCPDHLETLDPQHDGAVIGTLAVGDGLDAIDYVPARHELVAAAASGKLVVARLDASGAMTALATVPTARGARNAVASADGTAFVAHGPAGRILVVPPGARAAGAGCSAAVSAAVAKAFPGGTSGPCIAEREDGRDQFSVKVVAADGALAEADVSPAGEVLQTEQGIALTAVPPAVAAALAAKYPGAQAVRAERIGHPGKPPQFELKLSTGKEATFAEDGAFVEEE